MTQKMSEQMGVPLVVENKGGANGNIGADTVAKALPDGYTILLAASGPIVVNQALYKLPYDPLKDLLPITQLTSYQYALVVAVNSPVQSLPQLVRVEWPRRSMGGHRHTSPEGRRVLRCEDRLPCPQHSLRAPLGESPSSLHPPRWRAHSHWW